MKSLSLSDPESNVPPAAGLAAWWASWRRMARDRIMNDGFEHLNMRWRFRAVVIAFALPFFAYVLWTAAEQAAIEKAHLREQTLSLATLIASRLDDHIEQMDRVLATAAHSIGADINDHAAVSTLLQSMRSNVPTSVTNIAVWSLSGKNLASLDPSVNVRDINIVDRRYFMNVIERLAPAIEAPIVSRNDGQFIAQFARPVFNGQGRLIAVITMATRLKELIAELDAKHRIAPGTLVAIADRSGTIVARSIDPDMWVGKQVGNLELLNAVFTKGSGTAVSSSNDGQARLVGYSVASKVPWVVYVGEPLGTVTAAVSQRLLKSLGLGLAVLIFVMLLAGRVASLTTKPLSMLAADAERFGAGDLDHRSDVVTGAEIATLAANFNRMAAALQEREIELEDSQRQMREIADHMPALITYIDTDERYRFVNSYVGRTGKLPASEMIGKTVREVRGDEVYLTVAHQLQKALAGEANSVEISGNADGGVFHFRVDYVPDRDALGNVRGLYAFTHDVTERKIAELQLAESEKRLVTITENLPAMICYVDATGRFRFANRGFEKWFLRPMNEIVGRTFAELMPTELAAQYGAQFGRGLKGETGEYELEIPIAGKRNRWLRSTFVPDVDEETGVVKGVYGMIHNVTAAKEAEQRLTRLAQFDTLTGIPNRHQFNEKLNRALLAAERDDTPLALMFLDIDHFKQINDRYGHGGGDALLKEFAQRLAECMRPTDAVARLAGDEFVVLLEGLHSEDEPQFIARKIIAAVQKPFMIEGHHMRVTTSIGIAMRVFEIEVSMLMKRADEALYEAKRAGRNTFRLAS
ncbi:MAG: diguanylate cyclase domain-containing protein [Burkholderiaceae bacterium]